MEDVKVEVMRARGAGGQVGTLNASFRLLVHNLTVICST